LTSNFPCTIIFHFHEKQKSKYLWLLNIFFFLILVVIIKQNEFVIEILSFWTILCYKFIVKSKLYTKSGLRIITITPWYGLPVWLIVKYTFFTNKLKKMCLVATTKLVIYSILQDYGAHDIISYFSFIITVFPIITVGKTPGSLWERQYLSRSSEIVFAHSLLIRWPVVSQAQKSRCLAFFFWGFESESLKNKPHICTKSCLVGNRKPSSVLG
jgi:hypothetical protein